MSDGIRELPMSVSRRASARPSPRLSIQVSVTFVGAFSIMAKPHRRLKKANHGARPANSKARKAKRKHIRT